jgi:hypothetical protein
MPALTLRSLLPLFAVLALLGLAAPAHGQDNVLRARDLRGAPPRLYDAIAQLRPEWLQVGADSSGLEHIAVYVNGRYLGDGRLLRTLETARTTSARLRSGEYIRATDLPQPPEGFAVAIEVTSRPLERAAAPGRVTLSLDAGADLWPLAHALRVSLADAGYHRQSLGGQEGTTSFEGASIIVPSASGSLHYALAGAWGVGLTAQHTLKSVGGGYSPERQEAVSAGVTTTEAALLVTRDSRALRFGVGPVLRRGDWAWARGFCRCQGQQQYTRSELGAAAEARVSLPYGTRVFPAFRVMARYYVPREAEYPLLAEPVDVGGLVVSTSLSVGTRF